MSRELKFRAWTEWETMVDVPTINFATSEAIMPDGEWYKVKLMQYVGLEDMHDHEIFEGDIVEFTYWWFDGNQAESTLTGTVVYIPEACSFGLEGVKNAEWIKHVGGQEGSSDTLPFAALSFSTDDIEIIGNIYDDHTPEALPSVEGLGGDTGTLPTEANGEK